MISDLEILESKAIEAAISLGWEEAISLNKTIIKIDKENLSACLRNGFAYLQLNNTKQAKKYYRMALKIQPKNQVALDNLERIEILDLKKDKKNVLEKVVIRPNLYLDAPGKTKTVALVNIGQKNVLAKLMVGQEVILKIKKRRVEVRTQANEFVGNLPDDISRRLIFFIKAKSQYSTYIKESSLSRVAVFIIEECKGKTVASHLSFPISFQKNIINLPNEEKEEINEDIEDLEESWEKLTSEISEEEKVSIVGIQTDESEDEEE